MARGGAGRVGALALGLALAGGAAGAGRALAGGPPAGAGAGAAALAALLPENATLAGVNGTDGNATEAELGAWEAATAAVDGEAEPYPGVEFLGITDPEDAGGSPDVPAEGIVPSDGLTVEGEANVEVPAEGLMPGFNDTAGSPDVPAEGIQPGDGLPVEAEAVVEIPAEGYMGADG